MRRIWTIMALLTVVLLVIPASAGLAQTDQADDSPALILFTSYPSQVIGVGESPTIKLTLRATGQAQTAQLAMKEMPEGWTATFRGGSTLIKSVYVGPEEDATVNLKLDPPPNAASMAYHFVVQARGEHLTAELPLELSIQEKLPPRLALDVDLPTQRGKPSSTFRYSVTLKNEGDENLDVNLMSEAPAGWEVTFKSGGQEVVSLPLETNQSKSLSVEAKPYLEIATGSYPLVIQAQGDSAQASLALMAEVVGESSLTVTAPDGRLSGKVYAGKETPLKVVVRNTGSAPARAIELSASEPTGWSVEFDPAQIGEIPAGDQVEVTAKIRPSDKALAGDYMLTVRARPEGGSNDSAEFRITVLTSTLWGIVGVALIAIAVGVVALAVLRFGRR